jgi:hypothetical protein
MPYARKKVGAARRADKPIHVPMVSGKATVHALAEAVLGQHPGEIECMPHVQVRHRLERPDLRDVEQ